MIAKGNQRGGGQNLATHLLNAQTNEQINVMEITGSVAQDLHGAMSEWLAVSKGTFCKKYLYSLSINPDPAQGALSQDQYLDFIARTEKALGLTEQPRAIVVHTKEGREHYHVVWSRINLEEMKAVHINHDHVGLARVCREFARDHGLALPEGMQDEQYNDRSKEGDNRSEKGQEDRTGISRAERMEVITKAYQQSDTGKAFVHALTHAGYLLARGDKKNTYVVVDRFGEVHGLPRQIKGVKKKEIHNRLQNYPLEKLPDIEAAKKFAAQREKERQGKLSEEFQKATDKRLLALQQKQAARHDALNKNKHQQEARQREEKQALTQRHQTETIRIKALRVASKPTGLAAFLGRITGMQMLIGWKHTREDAARVKKAEKEFFLLAQRHKLQRIDLERHFRAAKKLEVFEKRSLHSLLHKEQLRENVQKAREETKTNIDSPKMSDTRSRAMKKAKKAAELAKKQRKDFGRNH